MVSPKARVGEGCLTNRSTRRPNRCAVWVPSAPRAPARVSSSVSGCPLLAQSRSETVVRPRLSPAQSVRRNQSGPGRPPGTAQGQAHAAHAHSAGAADAGDHARRTHCPAHAAESFPPVFADYLRTKERTLENWEQGRARPNQHATLLIRLLERYPDTVKRLAMI